MSVKELKEKLHKEIEALENPTALQMLHDAASEFSKITKTDILDLLSSEQLDRLNKSLEQAGRGDTIPHEEALKKIQQWRSR